MAKKGEHFSELKAHPTDSVTSSSLSESNIDDKTFQSFIENLPVMFYAVTPTAPHKPIFISPEFERFGYPLSDWLTKPDIWDIVTHPDDRDEVLGKTREALTRGESTDFEYRVVCKDGSVVWIRDRGCMIRDVNDRPICWQGVVFDITSEKQSELEIERREKLYRTLARHIPRTAVLLFDRELHFTSTEGEHIQHDTDWAEGDGQNPVDQRISLETIKKWEPYYRKALSGEMSSFVIEENNAYFRVDIIPVRDEGGDIFAGMVMWEDISEQTRYEEALRQSEARYRELFENANDIIYVHDLDGNYISINSAAERIFGYSRDEALTMNMAQVAAPEHLERLREQLALKAEGELSQTVYEVDCIRKDGGRVTLEVNSSIILQDGNPVAVQGVARDITERKNAEEALRRSEESLAAAQRITNLGSWEIDLSNLNEPKENTIGWSDEVYRIFGYEPRSVPISGALVFDAISENDRERVIAAFNEAVSENKFLEVEAYIILPDGSARLVKAQAETLFDEKTHKPAKMVGTIQDITDRRRAEEAVLQSEARFRDLFENANDLIYTHDLDGNFTSLNNAGEIITGYSRDEALRMNIAEVVAPEFLKDAQTMTNRKIADQRPTSFETEIIAKDGRRVILDLSTRLIVKDGLPIGVQGIGRDVTDRRRAEGELLNTLSLFATTFESTADGIVVMGLDRQIVTCNKKFKEMWNVSDEILASRNGTALIDLVAEHLLDPDEFRARLNETYLSPEETISEILQLKDGRIIERYSQPQYLEGKPIGRVASFRDITERTRAEERLRHYALHDTLTDLPNRVQFMNHLRQAVERANGNDYAKFAVLFLDLDRFKVINDSLGHAVGDKLLKAISERLTACVRPGDVVARLGGDEFTILLNRSGETAEVAGVAERLQATISEPFKIDNYEVFTTASIGIVVAGHVDRTAEDFLRDADAAMYRAKEAGKARYEIFDREMHVRNMNLLQVETDLRHAVERNEFELLYQPIVDLETGAVSEFEALIRWRHPVHGLVSPNEFVHVAEETGLIIQMGKWVLIESCRQIAEWQARFGLKLSISVNLSAKQLMHPTLTAQVKDVLFESGLDPSQLKLEVTESTVMEHSERSLKVLSELDELGIALSTDDFGTGYSSLSYLQRFPFDRLKIDRSFINLMDDDEKSGAIVKTILMLGKNLSLEVVAEGIETQTQLDKLRELGCRSGQGYLFSRPVDVAAAEQILMQEQDPNEPAFRTFCPPNMSSLEISELQ